MSKVVVVAVRDQAVMAYGNPWFAPTVNAALRYFADAVNKEDPNNQWNKHPADFSLWELGSFDLNTGLFDTGQPRQIAVAKDVLVNNSSGD